MSLLNEQWNLVAKKNEFGRKADRAGTSCKIRPMLVRCTTAGAATRHKTIDGGGAKRLSFNVESSLRQVPRKPHLEDRHDREACRSVPASGQQGHQRESKRNRVEEINARWCKTRQDGGDQDGVVYAGVFCYRYRTACIANASLLI